MNRQEINYEETTLVKTIVKSFIKKYETITLDTVQKSTDAPTENGKEIEIILFPSDYKDKDEKYFQECEALYYELKCKAFLNKMTKDIERTNTYNFIYIITEGDDDINNEKRIKEIKKIIKEFADADQYSVNNEYVKALYKELRELEGREQIKEEDYEPVFIGGSDVPIGGYYE